MGKFNLSFNRYNGANRRRDDCPCDNQLPPPFPPFPPCLFRSCYIEASGDTQAVMSGSNIVFDNSSDYIDIAGYGIEIDETGGVFTITRPGLYHVEWSVNLESGANPVLIGLLENGEPASALSNVNTSGNHSSGALINVTEADIPFTISLHNFGGDVSLTSPAPYVNTAASFRIMRFADAPSLVF